jgi:YVTN family beta-propeller protein
MNRVRFAMVLTLAEMVFFVLPPAAHPLLAETTPSHGEASPIADAIQRVELLPGYSLLPPLGADWQRLPRDKPPYSRFQFALGRADKKGAHTIMATGVGVMLSEGPQEPRELLDSIYTAMRRNFDPARHHPLEDEFSRDSSMGVQCLRVHQKAEDLVPGSRGGAALLEAHYLICVHPESPRYVIILEYSQRTVHGAEPLSLESEREAFLGSLKFTPLGTLAATTAAPRIYLCGFSFSRPPRDSWPLWRPKQGSGAISFRRELAPDRRLSAGLLTWILTGVRNPEELVASVQRDLRDPDLIGRETRVLSGEATRDSILGVPCVRYHYRYLRSPRGKDVGSIYSVYGIRMMHPHASRPVVASVWYQDWKDFSDRKNEGALAASPELPIDPEGKAFLESLRFVERDDRLQYSDTVGDVQGVAVGHGSVWVAEIETHEVFRIDPANGHVVARIPVGHAPVDVAIDEGAVWVTNSADATVSRIDPRTNGVAATVKVGKRPHMLAVGAGAIWVTNGDDGTVSRIDPRTNQTLGKPLKIGGDPAAILYHDGVIWVTDYQNNRLLRIDPVTNARSGEPISVGAAPNGLAFGAGSLWVNCQGWAEPAAVWRVDPSNGTRVALIPMSGLTSGIAFGHDRVWVCNHDDGTISKIDPATNKIVGQRIHAGLRLLLIRAAEDALWVTDQAGGVLIRVPYE